MVVHVIEHCKISPPSGSVSSISLPLTIFDIFWLPTTPIERLFFYEIHRSKEDFTQTILPNIKHSLSLTLEDYFPLCGNLAWPHDSSTPVIQYIDGDSASLYVAESDSSFDTLIDGSNARDVNAFYPLAPKLLHNSSTKQLLVPLMALQVTFFPNKGICIGITYNHVVADGRTLQHFIKSWASICKLEGKEKDIYLLPYYDRSTVNKNPIMVDTLCLSSMKRFNITSENFQNPKDVNRADSTDKVLSTFVMTPHLIQKLRQWVLSQTDKETLHFSSFVLTCAYVWVCLKKARWGEIDVQAVEDDEETFGFPLDSRSRLDPPLPIAYFGNCITLVLLKMKRSQLLGKEGMFMAAQLIGNSIKAIENGDALLKRNEYFLSGVSHAVSPDRLVTVAGATKFGIYETDFGWGKPTKTEVISISNGNGAAFSVSECPSEVGAVEIGLACSSSGMDAFAYMFETTIKGLSFQ